MRNRHQIEMNIKTDAWCVDCRDVGWLDNDGRCDSCARKAKEEQEAFFSDLRQTIRKSLGLK